MSERGGSDIEGSHRTTQESIEDDVIQIQSRSISDPTLSEIDFKNKISGV